jgi:drug/metabolite transporter (DMT)-like permease
MQTKAWGTFLALGLIWGTSFLWIKLALEEIQPFMVVFLRLAFGLIGLLVVMWRRRERLPREAHIWRAFGVMGLLNVALPWVLITWAETHVTSSLASILNGTMPLFTTVIAHFALDDEAITPGRALGLLLGFVGMFILVGRDFNPAALGADLLDEGAILLAVLCYAVSIVYARKRLRGQRPVIQATASIGIAWLTLAVLLPFTGEWQVPVLPLTWLAVGWLGLLGSCTAFIMSYWLLEAWGPTRSSLLTYVFPVVGLVLGITFLDEPADWRLFAGSALVVAGIAFVNWRTLTQLLGRINVPAG